MDVTDEGRKGREPGSDRVAQLRAGQRGDNNLDFALSHPASHTLPLLPPPPPPFSAPTSLRRAYPKARDNGRGQVDRAVARRVGHVRHRHELHHHQEGALALWPRFLFEADSGVDVLGPYGQCGARRGCGEGVRRPRVPPQSYMVGGHLDM